MNANSFKAFGYLVISLNLIVLGTDLISSRSQPIKSWVALCTIFMVGLGLTGLRKWAAIYFSAPLLFIGLAIFWSSVEQVPFPVNLLSMLWGVSLMLPAVVTVRLWRHLSWHGKWFF